MEKITIKVGKLPGSMDSIDVEGGCTVQKALEIAQITDHSGYEVRKNGEIARLEDVVTENDIIVVVRKIEGN